MTNYIGYFLSPLGWLELTASDEALIKVHFMKDDAAGQSDNMANEVLQVAKKQLNEFFAGERKEFNIPLNPSGTEFQLKVWYELQKIPFGKTISYIQLAQKVGSKEHTRAVGLANGKNPIAIIIPCHRVIGANGELTGYAGGMKRKQWLLEFESQQGKLF